MNVKMKNSYWTRVVGIDIFKVKYYFQYWLYKYAGIALPKLKRQYEYWSIRGEVYMDEILSSGYLDREKFFQDLLIGQLRAVSFASCFEAGCGFGWNLKRIQEEFPSVYVSGLDFSVSQLQNAKSYLQPFPIQTVQGNNCRMPFRDRAFDIGFSVGVFMNIHSDHIRNAIGEMIRVCGKYIIHLEYDQDYTTQELKQKRIFKTNIISHSYKNLYESFGKKIKVFSTYRDFADAYLRYQTEIQYDLNRWEGFEGPEKYILIVVEL